MSNYRTLISATLLACLTTGCGGGGGGGGNAASNDAVIDADNATEIAGDAVEGVMDTAELGEFGDLLGLATGVTGPGSSLSKAASTMAMSTLAKATPGGYMAAGGEFQLDCPVSGSATVTVSIAEPDTLSRGDRFSFRFDNCDSGEGETIDGAVTLRVDGFSGDLPAETFAVDATLTFDRLSVDDGTDTVIADGRIALSADSMRYPRIAFSQASDSFVVTEDGETIVLSDWVTLLTVDESSFPPGYSLSGAGEIDVPRHGNVRYEFREPFAGFGDDHPDSGVLYIEGGNGGSILVTVLSNTQVRLDVDYDGGGIDETITLTWEELED
jgi:hypothetical protein